MIDDSFNSKITADRTAGGATGFSRSQQDSSEKREPRHFALNFAIAGAVDIERRLISLIDKIVGEQRKKAESADTQAPTPIPTLAEILDTGHERIRNHTSRTLALIDNLESLLF
jgi:hypothetical protein